MSMNTICIDMLGALSNASYHAGSHKWERTTNNEVLPVYDYCRFRLSNFERFITYHNSGIRPILPYTLTQICILNCKLSLER